MPTPASVLSDFHVLLPPFQGDQQETIDWLAAAHIHSRGNSRQEPRELGFDPSEDREAAYQRMRKLITRFGCDPSRIQNRNSAIGDFNHTDWSKMTIFDLGTHPSGKGSGARSRVFSEVVNAVFLKFYSEEVLPPAAIIHVTCTGYVSPSGAQRLVSERGWGDDTEVVHAYHMGCYASLPANRIAQGLLARGSAAADRVDIVHTELCTLHMNPSLHSPEQLVVQSLFADGFIKYTASKSAQRGFEVLALREKIVPGTESAMTWEVGDFGMVMSLERDVPDLISSVLPGFFDGLCERVGVTTEKAKADSVFAIHPGGPKVIERVQQTLGLSDAQVQSSRDILKSHGNMSSATLPHVWKKMLEDPAVVRGQMIFSFAFGPGLTISSGVLRKL